MVLFMDENAFFIDRAIEMDRKLWNDERTILEKDQLRTGVCLNLSSDCEISIEPGVEQRTTVHFCPYLCDFFMR